MEAMNITGLLGICQVQLKVQLKYFQWLHCQASNHFALQAQAPLNTKSSVN